MLHDCFKRSSEVLFFEVTLRLKTVQLIWTDVLVMSDINPTDSSHQITLMEDTFQGKMNQSAPETREMNLWCLYLTSNCVVHPLLSAQKALS